VTAGPPSPDPWAPLPDKYVSPARRLRPRTLLVITIAGVLLLAGFGYAVGSLFDSGDPRPNSSPGKGAIPPWRSSTPAPSLTPTPSATPAPSGSTASPSDFATIADVCALLPRNTMTRLVGKAKDVPDSDPPTWRCSRYHEQDVGGDTLARDVEFDITLGPTATSSSATFAELREEARTRSSGSSYFGAEFGPIKNVQDVGAEAYYQYESEQFYSGTGIVVTRVRNAIIEVDYGGYTGSLKTKRMADKTARSGAIEITRGVIKALIK
jgi:hypothetical protein